MATLDHKLLIKTQLAATAQVIGTPAAGKEWHLKQFVLFNTGATNETIQLRHSGTGDANLFEEYTLEPQETYLIPYEYPMILGAAIPLYGQSDTVDTVNIFVFGAEVDA